MAYPADLVGKYINYRIEPGGVPKGLSPDKFGLLPGQTAPVIASVYDAPNFARSRLQDLGQGVRNLQNLRNPASAIAGLARSGNPWSFTLLRYVPGYVTTSPLTSVITGPMSGCYLCTYKQNQTTYLAHIGTSDDAKHSDTLQAKTAWLKFIERDDVSEVKGACPDKYFQDNEIGEAIIPPYKGARDAPSIMGYFEGGSAYAVLFSVVPVELRPPVSHLLRVTAVKQMAMQPWSVVSTVPEFSAAN
jgi:hypothetical protein